MIDKPHVLATADEIRTIFRRALDALDALDAVDDDDDDADVFDREQHRLERDRARAAIEAIRFCCIAAGQLGDPALIPLVVEALEICERFDDHADDDVTAMASALTWLLAAGAPAGAEIQELARHGDARVRAAIAAGLRPAGDREIALLEALSTDPLPDVRNRARKALSPVREIAWWRGKLSADPVARLSDEEALALKPTFERLSALLDEPRWAVTKREAELVELASALPDALAVDLAETVHSAADRFGTTFSGLLALMLARQGGVAAFKRLLDVWGRDETRYYDGKEYVPLLNALPAPARIAACKELAAFAAGLPDKARQAQIGSAGRLTAELVGAAWPPGEDLTPLLDILLTIPPAEGHDIDWVSSGLQKALSAEGADPAPILARALEARLAGYPGSWKKIGSCIDALLRRASGPELRAAAERAALGEDPGGVRWGIGQLLGPARDPERDGPLDAVIARLLADPKHRKAILADLDLRKRASPALRAELRAGRLEIEEATLVLSVLGDLWGGVAVPGFVSAVFTDDNINERRAKDRAALEAFLGPEELRGPPSAEDWAALRAAHARHLQGPEGAGVEHLFRPMPVGPWDAEDQAMFDEALRRIRAGDTDLIVRTALGLSAKPAREHMPLVDDLIGQAEPDARSFLRRLRANMRATLGLPPLRRKGAAGEPATGAPEDAAKGEWMDEDEAE